MSTSTAWKLAEFATGIEFSGAGEAVRARVRWIVADTIAAMAAGSAEPEIRALGRVQSRGPSFASASQPATLVGLGAGALPDSAALINGSAGTFLEMDEGNRFARGHAAIHVVPAALAFCEDAGADADAFLSAVLSGYEVCSRIATASRLRSSMHPHGTWGTIGAAVASGRAAQLSTDRMAELIGIASSLMTATSKQTMLDGGLVRNVYAGLANRQGLLALQLLQSGFTAERDGLRTMFGSVISEHFDEASLVAGLPTGDMPDAATVWHVMHNYFKLHSCCRFNHAALDAVDDLQSRGVLPAACDVERVLVETYGFAAELNDPAPRNTLAGKFSVPFAIATRLVNGSSGVDSFTWNAVRDPEVLALAARVTVREDGAMTKRLPGERPARVIFSLKDGRTVSAEVASNRGDEASPYTEEELRGKFIDLTSRVWPREHCHRLLDATLALASEGSSMRRWTELLRHPYTAQHATAAP
jgi:2-methylcitrate dehydratase PrpD